MDFLDILRRKLETIIDERAAAKAELDAVLAAPTAEGRDLNAAETAKFAEHRDVIALFDGPAEVDGKPNERSISALQARVAELEGIEARKVENARRDGVAPDAPVVRNVRVTSEERTYSRAAERRGTSFLRDVASARFGDFTAAQRLERHIGEERVERPHIFGPEARAVGTSAFAGLVVPQYLTDMYGPDPKAARPLANIMTRHELPEKGMTVELSRITTPTSAAIQSSQNSAVSETNIDDTALSLAVKTVAGQQTASRQALERGTLTESAIMADLLGEMESTLDSTLINEATTGLANLSGVNSVAYTDASATAAEAWPKLFDAVSQAQAGGLNVAQSTALLLHPRRFWWFASQVGTNFPFVTFPQVAPQQGGNVESTGYGQGMSGRLGPLPAFVDANVATNTGAGTNEDTAFVLSLSEAHLWEDEVVTLRAEQTAAASLGVLFVVSRYFAYTFGRQPASHSKITGTGFITPTF